MFEVAQVILSHSMQRVELAAQNLANITTPGYKSYRAFADALEQTGSKTKTESAAVDFANGKLQSTGNPFDLAIAGSGFFQVRTPDGIFCTRSGQFARDNNGNLTTPEGFILQAASGDVSASSAAVKVLPDGTVLDGAEPVARIAVVDFDDLNVLVPMGGGLFAAPVGSAHELADPQIRQGMLESSNVSAANEMVSIMASLRSAEGGQKVVQIYDDLMGRVVTAFGQ